MIRSLKISAIIVLVIVDLVAISLAIKHVNQDPPVSATAAVAGTPETSALAETTAPPAETTPTGLAVSGDSIGRFVAGTCDAEGSASLQVSSDRGARFVDVALPGKSGATAGTAPAVRKILSVDFTSATTMTLIGDDADCKPVRWTTDDAGKSWKQKSSTSGWYVDGGSVVAPDGKVDPGCSALAVSAVSDRNAKVACKDSAIRGTDDAGQNWVALGSLDGVTTVSFSSVSDGFALAKSSDCAARAYSTVSAGGSWKAGGCLDPSGEASAIAGTPTLLAALVGPKVYVSLDQGASWKASPQS